MGYLYRPTLKGKEHGYEPAAADLALSRGGNGNGQGTEEEGHRCHHPEHGKIDFCRGCLARFGKTWWAKYYVNGRAIRESTGTEKETEARRFLKAKEGRAAEGQPILPRADRVRFEEAETDLITFYETTGKRDLREVKYRLAHLRSFFAGRRLANIGPADATAYAEQRRSEPDPKGKLPSNGTINRELALLVRLLGLAYENGKLLRLPVLRKLKEAAPRQGFFEREPFEAVRRHLPADLRVAVTIAHTFGWRMQSEVLILELRQVDLEAGTIRLDPGQTKNDDGRLVYLTPELKTLLTAQVDRVMALMRARSTVIPYLFPHLKGRFAARRIRDFRKTWATACKRAGFAVTVEENGKKVIRPLFIRHDFRRTAVRNMVNLGIPERVAMTVTGHKTRAVFDRYHIVSPGDLQEVARKLTGTFSGTFGHSALDDNAARV
jgi:integrase